MKSLIVRFTILLGCCLISATPVTALTINVDTVWPAGTYTINDNLAISGATLTIQAGATVRIAADGYIWVQSGGVLDATGVTFTWADGVNEWRGINFFHSDSRSRLVNCTIEHAKGYNTTFPAMIYYESSSGTPRIEGCAIGNGTADQGILARAGASVQILNNTVSGFSDCGINLAGPKDTTVSGNTIQDNTAGIEITYSGGSSRNLDVSNNTYSNNTESDLRIEYGSVPITIDAVWNEAPGTRYRLQGFAIQDPGRLLISDGIVVELEADGLIWVQSGGVLDATGVTFTWADGVNEWRGINFFHSDSRSRLVNCTIEHAKGYNTTFPAMIYYESSSGTPRIEGCAIGNGTADQGILARAGASVQILNNTVSGFSDCGINLAGPKDTTVSGNTIQDNTAGIEITYSGGSSRNLDVSNNTYSNNTESDLRIEYGSVPITIDAVWNEAPGTRYRLQGFAIQDPGRLLISDGIVVELEADGLIWVQSGGVLDATGVTFTWADGVNEWRGINFFHSDSRSRLVNCTIEHAKGYSDTVPAMIYFYASAGYLGPQIEGCEIGNGTADQGIHVSGGASAQILNNSICDFSDCGVRVVSSSTYFIVAGNIFSWNYRGIGIFNGASGLYRVNIIQDNSEYGIYNAGGSGYKITEAEYNWWGDASGPQDLVDDGFYNPTGTGDPVSSYVDYVPWTGSANDSEPDGIWDEWEIDNFTDIFTAADNTDFDADGLLDTGEFLRGTDPKNTDSDGDGVFDGLEVQCLLNPLLPGDFGFDSDGDSFSDLRELLSGTDEWNSADIPEIIADHDPQPSGDNDVDGKDLLALIIEMGSTSCTSCQSDLDGDGDVDRADVFLFAEDFGRIQ